MPAEAKMEALYADIFSSWDWSNDDFMQDYHQLMGMVLGKTPLSSSALLIYSPIPPSK
jgi:hypothetical protein